VLLLVRLKFKSAFRIGGGETTQDDEFQGILHSDTLFSALMNEWVRLFPDDEFDKLVADIPFKLSSAFPYYINEYYLPTPIGTGKLYMEKLRDAPFLELYDFLDLANGNDKGILKKELNNPVDDMMFSLTVPRVSIDRISAATNIFESSGWFFKDGGGLYFLVELIDETISDKFALCMRLLGQSGLGADRSIGCGLFESEIENIDAGGPWTDLFGKRDGEKTAHCALSLICPSKEEAKEALSYRLLTRKGWIFSRSSTVQMKRRACKMLAEGSLLRKPINGGVASVTPMDFIDHRVYRYGIGMMVKIVS
jgi:CRISPR-associated protein Csm4